jgi:WD40 repeat protein
MLGGYIVINNIYLIIGSFDNEIKIFDINNGIIVKKFNKHTSYVIGVKAIKDKNNTQYFVSYGYDKNIYLWSLE